MGRAPRPERVRRPLARCLVLAGVLSAAAGVAGPWTPQAWAQASSPEVEGVFDEDGQPLAVIRPPTTITVRGRSLAGPRLQVWLGLHQCSVLQRGVGELRVQVPPAVEAGYPSLVIQHAGGRTEIRVQVGAPRASAGRGAGRARVLDAPPVPGSRGGAAPARELEREQVLELVDDLGAADPAARQRAMDRLAGLGPAAHPVLRQALAHPDPQVRFTLLYLLQQSDVYLERQVRQIVENEHSSDSGTYPEALAARNEILRLAGIPAQALSTRAGLVALARRRARLGSEVDVRYVVTALDLLAELLEGAGRVQRLDADDAARVAQLLDEDLDEGFYELTMCLAAIDPELALPAVREVLTGGSPRGQAAAARVLAEVVPRARARHVAPWVVGLLDHEQASVRLAALEALANLPLRPADLVAVGRLTTDDDHEVAAAALRLAGERSLDFVREAAEQVAGDPGARGTLRQQAVRTLGLLGHTSSLEVLRQLARGDAGADRRLRLLAAWALGAARAEGAREQLEELVGRESFAQEDILYAGLARLEPGQALEALGTLARSQDGARRVRALRSLGMVEGRPDAVATTLELAARRCLGEPSREQEFVAALESLTRQGQQGSDPARAALAQLLLSRTTWQSDHLRRLLEQLLMALGSAGGPEADEALARRLSHKLRQLTISGGQRVTTMITLGERAAEALARVDPEEGRVLIRRILNGVRGGDQQQQKARNLARILARAGDRSQIPNRALAYSRQKLEQASPEERNYHQNNVGIDLLYAHQLDEAVLEFRRMLWSDPRDYIAAYNIACGYSLAGQVEDSLRYLRRAVRNGYRDPRHMASDPDLDALRGDPRFEALLERLRLHDETPLPFPVEVWPGGSALEEGEIRDRGNMAPGR